MSVVRPKSPPKPPTGPWKNGRRRSRGTFGKPTIVGWLKFVSGPSPLKTCVPLLPTYAISADRSGDSSRWIVRL